jgi:hypothetical protein
LTRTGPHRLATSDSVRRTRVKRTTISLPDSLAIYLADVARRRDISVSQLVLEAIEAQLTARNSEPVFADMGPSGLPPVAHDIDAALEELGFGTDSCDR